MVDQNKDLATLLEDVKTIKTILQNEDAPLPRMWVPAWIAGSAITIASLLQYFVPWLRSLDFDARILWLWFPGFCIAFPLVVGYFYWEMGRIGKKFLGQSRVRHLLYARFIIPPAALVLIWLASRNPVFSLEGTILLIAAIWQTALEQVVPHDFRPIPFGFLTLGLVEIGFHLSSAEVTLFNGLLIGGTLAFAGFLFWRRDSKPSRQR